MKTLFFPILLSTILAASALKAEEIRLCSGEAPRQNILVHIEKDFEKETGIKIVYPIDVKESGSAESFQGIVEGKCDAATTPVDFDNWVEIAQKAKVKFDKKDFAARVIGRDLVKFVIHPENNLASISSKSLAGLWTGKVKNWKEVGGPDAPVKLFLVRKKPATSKNVQSILFKNENFSSEAVTVENWQDAIDQILTMKGGIVFMAGNADSGKLKVLKTEEEIGRPITMMTKGRPSPSMVKLYDFINKKMPIISKK